jgi:hypothetical protein
MPEESNFVKNSVSISFKKKSHAAWGVILKERGKQDLEELSLLGRAVKYRITTFFVINHFPRKKILVDIFQEMEIVFLLSDEMYLCACRQLQISGREWLDGRGTGIRIPPYLRYTPAKNESQEILERKASCRLSRVLPNVCYEFSC